MAHLATPVREPHVTPDFDAGDSVWLRLENKEIVDLTVVGWVEEGGKYLYQLKDSSGELWQGGRRVQQKDLASSGTRREPPSTSYEKAAALLLSWHPDIDDAKTHEEVIALERVFRQTFRYATRTATLNDGAIRSFQIQVNKHLSDFVYDHDGGNTLLIIYYAGHGRPGKDRGMLHLTGSTSMPSSRSEPHKIVWNSAEIMIKDIRADVLVIFDCCYASEPAQDFKSNQAFEFLAATPANQTTRGPGPQSFTSNLIWALEELNNHGSFSTHQLLKKITYAPSFPQNQCPRLHGRHPSSRNIVLSPLTQESVKTAGEVSRRKLSDLDTTLETGSISSFSPSLNASRNGDFSTSHGGHSVAGVSTLPSSAPESHGNSQKRDFEIDDSHLSQSTVHDTLGDEDDMKTLYSFITESSAESDGQKYQAHFGHDLFSYISSLSENENDISRLSKDLPELLQIFTRKLGSESSAQVYRDIMRYVHKHRVPITQRFTNLVAQSSTQEDDISPNSRSGDLSYQEKVDDWQAKGSDSKLDNFPTEENMFEGVKNEDEDEDEDNNMSPALADFRRVVETSSAYNWLLLALKHNLLHSIPGESHIAKLRTAILSRDAFRRVSRKSPPVACNAEYIVDWDPVEFIRSQEYDHAPKDVIIKALTLTGNSTEVEALTCSDYISRTWPQSGHEFLSLLQALLESERRVRQQVVLNDGTDITVFLRDADCVFQVSGKVDTVVEIGEQISWISCALRKSDLEEAAICTPVLRTVTETGRTSSSVSLKVELSADIAPIELGVDHQGCCWRRLLRSPLLVQGYPIARRYPQTAGMEISLNTMMALMQARRIAPFKHRLFVKGHSTMLVAIKEVSGLVLWHVITNEDGRYIYYHDERVDQCSPTLEDSALSVDFAEKRHIVGWWSQVKNFAGTSSAKLDIRGSGLPAPGLGFAFDRVTVGGGKYLTVNVSAAFGKRDHPLQRTKEGSYSDQIRHVRTIHVVFYDVNDHRAWLVDGATALLHITRASLVADKKNGFRLLHQHHDIHEEEEVTVNSAVRILTNPENMDMKIYEQPGEEDSKIESKHVQGDSDPAKTEITVTYKATHDRFSDRVSLIYSILDDIFNHQSDMSANGVGSKVSVSPLQQLEGFDFRDIAEGVKTLHPKTLSLGWKGMSWVDMLRDLHAITLFGRGFGDILEPQVSNPADGAYSWLCPGWSRVPCDLDYLAVSNMTLQGIIENQGEPDETPRLVARQLYWHCPDKYCEGCTESHTEPITSAQGCRCDRVQVILPKTIFSTRRFQSPEQIPIGGATIFGHSQKCPVRWKTSHSATETAEDGEPSTIAANERSSIITAARDNLKRKFGAFLGRSKPTKNAS